MNNALNNIIKKYISNKLDITVTNIINIIEWNKENNYIRYNYWTDDNKIKQNILIIDKNEYLRILRKEKIKFLKKQ